MKNSFVLRRILSGMLAFIVMFSLVGCGGSPAPAPTPAPTATPEPEVLAWPTDEAISYAPAFDAAAPAKIANQEYVYVMSYENVTLEMYEAYLAAIEANDKLTIKTNYNTRGNAFTLIAYKTDDANMELNVTFTLATKKMQIKVSHTPKVTVTTKPGTVN